MSEIDTSNQFVTFRIEDELYAINVFKIREILEVPVITKVPGMPEMIRGIINVRGDVIPVLDLKVKFGNEKTEFQRDTSIIITEIQIESDVIQVGIIVDAVRKVLTLEDEQVEAPPKIGTYIDNKFILGIGKTETDFIIILDIDKFLTDEDFSLLNEIV